MKFWRKIKHFSQPKITEYIFVHHNHPTGLTVDDITNIYDEPASKVITQHGYLTGLLVTPIINIYNMATCQIIIS